jgi:hypothetical protein
MIVETTIRVGFHVATRPNAHVHSVYSRSLAREWIAGKQRSQHLGVDDSLAQRGVEATPTARWES